ncbi:50S ribosome-binding GTPase [Luteimicrobium subarcticum]|uniref:50S ribosome-binding GTPase n=1 Tax=Luteimicrobium subarcticum TaxID=620910 RepID=A0A2M8WU81_9MICO|nr:50S ribosome-binding GTPase [Luteimicrobium subarcticum]
MPPGEVQAEPDATGSFTPTLYDVSRDLRRDVAAVELPLDLEGRDDAEASRLRLLDQLDQHLLPRLRELSAPAVVVVAGSTGAGKSTLYNSVLRREVSPAGVLRPTTREPVYAHHPLDADVVPDAPVTRISRVVPHDEVPRGVALLDAPDLDSLEDANRATAKQLLEGADLWLFVTTAARYGDALPWQTLELATERGASVAMVLNRVPRDSLATIRADLLQRLRDHGMANTPLFVVPDLGPHEGLLDDEVVAPVRRWLRLLAGPERSRSVILRTLQGSLDALPGWVSRVEDAVEHQVEAAAAIRRRLDAATPALEDAARARVRSGATVGGGVSGAWAQLTHARTDNVRVKSGVARSSKRAGRKRDDALGVVLDALTGSVREVLVATAADAERTVRDLLTGPDAPSGGRAVAVGLADTVHEDRRTDAARTQVDAWAERGTTAAQALPGDRAAAARTAFGTRGLAALLLLSAAGLDDADRVLARVVGPDVEEPVAALRSDLADRSAATAGDVAHAVTDSLRGGPYDEAAPAALRLRRAEIARLTRHARVARAASRTEEAR